MNQDAEPVTTTGQRGNIVDRESNWRAIQGSLFVESVLRLTEANLQARTAGVQEGPT